MSYKIGSFNVRNLSWGNKGRDLDYIAEIISKYDIIALQEVLSEGKILEGPSLKDPAGQAEAYERSLKFRLGDKWDMCWLDPKTDSKWYPYLGGDSRGEGYAFIWNTERFKCPVNEYGREIRPRIFRKYKCDASRKEMRLIRDPGYGRFQFVNIPNAEIRLITTHIIFGKPKEENLKKAVDIGQTRMRQNEFNILARSVYTRISEDYNDINCNVPYTIILGDYNLNHLDSEAGAPYVRRVVVLDAQNNYLPSESSDGVVYRIRTEQTHLSTINDDGTDYASNYDHFSYDDHTRDNIVQDIPRRLNVVEKAGGHQTYKEKVSDHIPIMLEIDLK